MALTCRDMSHGGSLPDGKSWMIPAHRLRRSSMTYMAYRTIWALSARVTVSPGGLAMDRALSPRTGADMPSDTAFVKSSKGWQYCEDSKITKAQEKDVVVSTRVLPDMRYGR